MKHLIIGLLLIFVTIGASAQDTKRLAAANLIASLSRIEAVATVARVCGLRSEHWQRSLLSGAQVLRITQNQHLPFEDQTTAFQAGQKEQAKVFADYPVHDYAATCRKLAASQELTFIDQIQYRMTGGYH